MASSVGFGHGPSFDVRAEAHSIFATSRRSGRNEESREHRPVTNNPRFGPNKSLGLLVVLGHTGVLRCATAL